MEQTSFSLTVALSYARCVLRGVTGAMLTSGLVASASGCLSGPSRATTAVVATPAAERAPEERPFSFLPPITLMSREEAADDAIVRVLSDVTCTGTLIAEDLVLTAHHCVAARDPSGRPTGKDLEPSAIEVELGGDYLSWGEVKVRAIVTPDCGYRSGAGDIAILVLKRKLIGVATLMPRLDTEPRGPTNTAAWGESVIPIGFGRCPLSRDAIHRVRRAGGSIQSVGVSDFVVQASICPGDSGGPALSQATGEVVGVISSSMMDGDDQTVAPSFFTRIDIWRPLFAAAHEIASGASPSELPPYRSCSR